MSDGEQISSPRHWQAGRWVKRRGGGSSQGEALGSASQAWGQPFHHLNQTSTAEAPNLGFLTVKAKGLPYLL